MNKYTIINNTIVTPVPMNTDSLLQERSAVVWDTSNTEELNWLWEEEMRKKEIMQEMLEEYGY